jgi:choline-sulfatase
VYTSDHGDQIGESGLFGKTTFFEGSAAIPLVFEGTGVQKGQMLKQAASLLDVGPTLCEMIGAEALPRYDGKSLAPQLSGGREDEDRAMLSENLDGNAGGSFTPGRMIRKGRWKYISYAGYENEDLLFDIEEDPYELCNRIEEKPGEARELRAELLREWNVQNIREKAELMEKHMRLLSRWGAAVDVPEPERWVVTEKARQLPVI